MKRKTIKQQAGADLYTLCDGKLIDVRKYVDDLLEEYGPEASFELDWYYDDISVHINYDRLETETEATKRITKARKAKETRKRNRLKKEEAARKVLSSSEEAERKLLADLKEKYE